MTVDECLTAREAFNGRRALGKKGRSSDSRPQRNTRKEYKSKISASLQKSYEKKGMSSSEARKLANKRTPEIMKNLNALHNQDSIAGGKNEVKVMGRADINKSIGPQWSSRVAEMDAAAEEAAKSQGGDTKMNVELKRCT